MEKKLELTLKDRLFLANQHKILADISSNEHEAGSHALASEVYENGYEYLYDDFINLSTPFTEEESSEVLGILNLYRELNNSLNTAKNKGEITEDVYKKMKLKVSFPGFDNNDVKECRMASFARFMVEKMGRYNEIKENLEEQFSWNSHRLMVAKYKRMLERLDSIQLPMGFFCSLTQIEEILEA